MSITQNYLRSRVGGLILIIAAVWGWLFSLFSYIPSILNTISREGLDYALGLYLPVMLIHILAGMPAAICNCILGGMLMGKKTGTPLTVMAIIITVLQFFSGVTSLLGSLFSGYSLLLNSLNLLLLAAFNISLVIFFAKSANIASCSGKKLWWLPGTVYLVYILTSRIFNLILFAQPEGLMLSTALSLLTSNILGVGLYAAAYFLICRWVADPFKPGCGYAPNRQPYYQQPYYQQPYYQQPYAAPQYAWQPYSAPVYPPQPAEPMDPPSGQQPMDPQ